MTRKYVRALKLHGILEIEAMKSNQPSPRETICKFQETMFFLKKNSFIKSQYQNQQITSKR